MTDGDVPRKRASSLTHSSTKMPADNLVIVYIFIAFYTLQKIALIFLIYGFLPSHVEVGVCGVYGPYPRPGL
jgi:hypothetical protein